MDLPEKANASAYGVFLFRFFFLCKLFWLGDKVAVHTHKVTRLFIGSATTLFRKNIKNGSTIHIFKNYFVTMFSVFSKISCIQTDSM